MKKNLKYIVFTILMIIFIFLAILVTSRNDLYIDNTIYSFISKFITNKMTTVVKFFTFMGSAKVVIPATLIAFIFLKSKKYGIILSIDLIGITILQFLLKYIFLRNRPLNINIIEETGYSFPSGHSLTAMAFYGLIIYFIFKSNFEKKLKYLLIIFLVILIFLIGISRIYLGVHYATDVMGGYLFSICYLIIFTSKLKEAS